MVSDYKVIVLVVNWHKYFHDMKIDTCVDYNFVGAGDDEETKIPATKIFIAAMN